MVFNQPDPVQIALRLQATINTDKRPQDLLYEFLNSGSPEANYLAKTMLENKEVMRIITSTKGRAWIHKWLDDFLNYLQKFGE
jgi:hypothetical protein